jgi:hypothetical protein
MDRFEQIARDLELGHNDVKWYESVQRTANALREAHRSGFKLGSGGDDLGSGDLFVAPTA